MMRVWADDDEIVCVHPGGIRVVGHAAVQSAWRQITGNGPMSIQAMQPLIMSGVMSSVHVLIEKITIQTAEGNKTAHCHTTNVFHKGRTGWKMILHHASHAPQDIDTSGQHERPGTLH